MNLWERLNDEVPEYMKGICQKYPLVCKKLEPCISALIGENYAVILAVGRFRMELSYLYKERGEYIWLQCENYWAKKFGADDRKNLMPGEDGETRLRNELLVIAHGLDSKWPNVLAGDKTWLRGYRRSMWYDISAERHMDLKEMHTILKTELFDDWA